MCSRCYTRDEKFDEVLNDTHKPVIIAGLTFYPADILYKCDPVAYHIASIDFKDAMEEEADEIPA